MASEERSTAIYLSPGISVGYTFGQGFNWGGQISLGLVKLEEPLSVLSKIFFPVPSLSLGFRNSKRHKIKFIDFQVYTAENGVINGGAGAGLAKITKKSSGYSQRYSHIKLYMGALPLAQLDFFFQLRSKSMITSLGATGVLPIPVYAISKETTEDP